jgi:alanine racemase
MKILNTYRKTWAEIDLDAITYNFKQIKKTVGTRVRVLAAIKANAYGHGLVTVGKHLEKLGIDFLGTSSVDEALELRCASVKCPILNLSNLLAEEVEAVIKFNITPAITDIKVAQVLNKKALLYNKKIPVHIKIDTGMGRIGIWYENAATLLEDLKSLNNLIIEGVYTHFPSAEIDREFTCEQIKRFNLLREKIESIGIQPKYLHTANSAAIFHYKQAHFNLVRPGLALYGVLPNSALKNKLRLKPALSLKTKIAFLKKVPKGRSISYGRTFITKRNTRIATLPVGYADGYSHLFSNKAKVLIKGKFYPVVGRVCMDQTMVDIGLKDDIKVGDEVILIGRGGKNEIKVEDLANICSTIPYQILCWIGSRVPRVYKSGLKK